MTANEILKQIKLKIQDYQNLCKASNINFSAEDTLEDIYELICEEFWGNPNP